MNSNKKLLEKDYFNLLKEYNISDLPWSLSIDFGSIYILSLLARKYSIKKDYKRYFMAKSFMDKNYESYFSPFSLLVDETLEKIKKNDHRVAKYYPPIPYDEIYFGEFPIATINATSKKTRNGYIALVNRGFFFYYECYIYTLFYALFSEDKEENKFYSFGLFMIRYIQNEFNPSDDIRNEILVISIKISQKLSDAEFHFATDIIEKTKIFVLGHEIGHIIGGHLKDDYLEYKRRRFDGVNDPIFIENCAKEIEADDIAFSLLDDELKFSKILTPFLYFEFEEILNKIVEVSMKQNKIEASPFYTTHPPPAIRQNFLKDIFLNTSEKAEFLQTEEMIDKLTHYVIEHFTIE